ncbi:MAG: hypothetical protein M1831_000806 [Alyxoria varia]|nr:MAG: hypothetical protein M1831_000806 [Alyxoria varia]
MKTTMRSIIVLALVPFSYGFPGMAGLGAELEAQSKLRPRQVGLPSNLPLSQNEGNSGPIPSLIFNAKEQFVNVKPGTVHEFRSPGPNDKRGPCPGLNAAANHGFLSRNGITTVPNTVKGLSDAYGFGDQFAAALAVIAIALTGDPTGQTWSIGGSYRPLLLGNLLANPTGISGSHNTYEADASPGRADAYLNGGDAVSLQIDRFDDIFNRGPRLTLDKLRDHNKKVHDFSVNNNPHFFQPPFAGLVPPIAHHFIINLMSNHSQAEPEGFLDGNVFKSFFAVTGNEGSHVWNKGQERIPDNWYRRPKSNPYDEARAGADVVILATKYPSVVRFGGNTGTPNSFVGVNPGDVTGGVITGQNLLQGNNLACFAFQAFQQGSPAVLRNRVRIIGPVVSLINRYINPVTSALNCPALTTFNQSAFNQYPGQKDIKWS